MGVELVDGCSQKWRFSKEDAIVNLAGGALGHWLESHPAADALLDVRIQYSRFSGPLRRRGFDPFSDYWASAIWPCSRPAACRRCASSR
jgi:hypothetical protein